MQEASRVILWTIQEPFGNRLRILEPAENRMIGQCKSNLKSFESHWDLLNQDIVAVGTAASVSKTESFDRRMF